MLTSKNYTPTSGYTEIVVPGESSIKQLHVGILHLTPETTFFDHSDDTEVVLIGLSGQGTLLVGHNGNKAYGVLGERSTVFDDDACIASIPHHTTYELLAGDSGIAVAVCKVASFSDAAAVILQAGESLDPGETRLRISERVFAAGRSLGSGLSAGREAVCFYQFREPGGSAVIRVAGPGTEEAESVRVQHNDVFAVPEQHEIVSMIAERVGYELCVGVV